MRDLMSVFFLVCVVVGLGVAGFGVFNLVSRSGDDRENTLWVARGVLILVLVWLIRVL